MLGLRRKVANCVPGDVSAWAWYCSDQIRISASVLKAYPVVIARCSGSPITELSEIERQVVRCHWQHSRLQCSALDTSTVRSTAARDAHHVGSKVMHSRSSVRKVTMLSTAPHLNMRVESHLYYRGTLSAQIFVVIYSNLSHTVRSP